MISKRHILCFAIAIAVFSMVVTPVTVQATTTYDSWIDGWETGDVYDGVETFFDDDEESTDSLGEMVGDWFSDLIESFTAKVITERYISWFVLLNDKIGLTVEKIVYGRVGTGSTNYFQFGLEDGNIMGVVGAILYSVLRNLMFIVFGILFLYLVIKNMIAGTGKNRSELKGAMYNYVFSFGMLYALPVAIDLLLFIRDAIIRMFVEITNDITGNYAIGVTDALIIRQADTPTYDTAIILACLLVCGFWFAYDYIKRGIQQIYLFGVFPVTLFRSFSDKQILNKWVGQFVTSLFVPLLDAVGIWFVVLMQDFTSVTDDASAILGLIVYMSIIPARNMITQFFGMPAANRGFSMMAAAMLLARGFGGHRNTNTKGEPADKGSESNGSNQKPIGNQNPSSPDNNQVKTNDSIKANEKQENELHEEAVPGKEDTVGAFGAGAGADADADPDISAEDGLTVSQIGTDGNGDYQFTDSDGHVYQGGMDPDNEGQYVFRDEEGNAFTPVGPTNEPLTNISKDDDGGLTLLDANGNGYAYTPNADTGELERTEITAQPTSDVGNVAGGEEIAASSSVPLTDTSGESVQFAQGADGEPPILTRGDEALELKADDSGKPIVNENGEVGFVDSYGNDVPLKTGDKPVTATMDSSGNVSLSYKDDAGNSVPIAPGMKDISGGSVISTAGESTTPLPQTGGKPIDAPNTESIEASRNLQKAKAEMAGLNPGGTSGTMSDVYSYRRTSARESCEKLERQLSRMVNSPYANTRRYGDGSINWKAEVNAGLTSAGAVVGSVAGVGVGGMAAAATAISGDAGSTLAAAMIGGTAANSGIRKMGEFAGNTAERAMDGVPKVVDAVKQKQLERQTAQAAQLAEKQAALALRGTVSSSATQSAVSNAKFEQSVQRRTNIDEMEQHFGTSQKGSHVDDKVWEAYKNSGSEQPFDTWNKENREKVLKGALDDKEKSGNESREKLGG